MIDVQQLRVVLVHDWLTGMRGGEKVLELFCQAWPQARLHTLIHQQGSVSPAIERHQPRASFFRFLPQVHRYYRYLLPFMPLAADRWKFQDCDLVLSSSSCIAKGAQAPPGVPHLCYCHTPVRYAWHLRDAYFGRGSSLKDRVRNFLLERIRRWDFQASDRVTHFIANSQETRRRIQNFYHRDAVVIHPPVNTDFFTPGTLARQDYYLLFSAMVPYKRLDLAIQACNRLKKNLVVIGKGPEEARLKALAGPTVRFLGWQSDESVRDHLRCCRALLFPGEEDFGIVPVEAQACGTPVIAYARGGAVETVLPFNGSRPTGSLPTGWWFFEQTEAALAAALEEFDNRREEFDPLALRRHALKFNSQRFLNEIQGYVRTVLTGKMPQSRAA